MFALRGIIANCTDKQAAHAMTPEGPTPEARHLAETPTQDAGTGEIVLPQASPLIPEPTVPTSGKRPALGNLRRELLDTELAHSGVQKLLLDRLDFAESENTDLRAYR